MRIENNVNLNSKNNIKSTDNNIHYYNLKSEQDTVSFGANLNKPTKGLVSKFKEVVLKPFRAIENAIQQAELEAKLRKEAEEAARLAKEKAAEEARLQKIAEEIAWEKRMEEYPNMDLETLKIKYENSQNWKNLNWMQEKEKSAISSAYRTKKIEKYESMTPDDIEKEIKSLLSVEEKNQDEFSIKLANNVLKNKGYIIFNGNLVNRTSVDSHSPLEIPKEQDIVKEAEIITKRTGGTIKEECINILTKQYKEGAISNYKYNSVDGVVPPIIEHVKYEPQETVQFRDYGMQGEIGSNPNYYSKKYFGTGSSKRFYVSNYDYSDYEFCGKARSWYTGHNFIAYVNEKGNRHQNFRYCTKLGYRAGGIGGRPYGFVILMEGDVPLEKIEHIRKHFIESGTIEKLTDASVENRDKYKSSEIIQEMLDYVAEYLNK